MVVIGPQPKALQRFHHAMNIDRLPLPTTKEPVKGWCLYQDDRWDGSCPQQEDEDGFIVYASEAAAYTALAREMRARCDYFEQGKLGGGELRCLWYPMPVSLFADGRLFDETNSEQYPQTFLDAGKFSES
jgi:hypothetical protein